MNNLTTDPRPTVYRRLAVAIGLFLLIAAPDGIGAQRSPRVVTEAELLPAILNAAFSDAGRGDVRVDPRPLKADATDLYVMQPEAVAPVSASVVDGRAAIIRAAGFQIVDTIVVNRSRNCPGALVPKTLDSLGRVDNRRSAECPEKPFDVIAVGPARPGSAAIPNDRVYDRAAETAACGYWAVRVIRTTLGHGGSSVYAADYVLAEQAGKWIVVKIVGIIYTE